MQKREPTKRDKIAGTILLIALIALIGRGCYTCSTNTPKEFSQEDPLLQEIHMKSSVKQYLNNTLKDPDSYEEINWGDVMTRGDSTYFWEYTMQHQYRAKNSFGGYVIEIYQFYFDKNGDVISAQPLQ